MRFYFLFVILSAFTFVPKEVKLEYNLKVNEQYAWIQSSKQTIKQSIPGMGDLVFNVSMDGELQLKVTEATTANAKMEAQYKKLKIVSTSMMANMNMDSESSNDDMQTKALKSIMGKPFYFTMDKTGNIENIEGIENLYSGMSSLGLDEASTAAARQSIQQLLNANSVKGALEMGLLSYPANKVTVGDSWTKSSALPMNFPVQVNNKLKLTKVEGTVASIDAEGELVTTDKEKINTLPNGIKSKVDLSGNQTLTGKVDMRTGWPSEIKISSTTKGKMVLLAGGMIPQDMDVPMEVTSETTYTIRKK